MHFSSPSSHLLIHFPSHPTPSFSSPTSPLFPHLLLLTHLSLPNSTFFPHLSSLPSPHLSYPLPHSSHIFSPYTTLINYFLSHHPFPLLHSYHPTSLTSPTLPTSCPISLHQHHPSPYSPPHFL